MIGAGHGGAVGEQAASVFEVQRPHVPQRLAGDAEGLATGGEDAHLRAFGQDAVGEPGRGLDHVLAVVQDDQPGGGSETGHQAGRRIGRLRGRRVLDAQRAARGVANAQSRQHRLRHVIGVAHRGQLGQPYTGGQARGHGLAGFDGQARLARPAGPEQGDQPMPVEQVGSVPEILLPADEAGQPRPEVPLPDVRHGTATRPASGGGPRLWCFLLRPHEREDVRGPGRPGCRGDVPRRRGEGADAGERDMVAAEHGEVQGREFGRGVGAEPVGEQVARRLVGRDRLHPAPAGVQGAHQQGVPPFAQRVGGDQRGQFGEHAGVLAEQQPGLQAVLHRGLAQPVEPGDLGVGHPGAREVEVGGTAPEGQCLFERARRPRQVAAIERGAACGGKSGEPVDVHLIRRYNQSVTRRFGGHQTASQDGAQARDQSLQRVADAAGRSCVPHSGDEHVHRHDAARVEQQRCEQRAQPSPAYRQGRAVVSDFERAEQREAHACFGLRRIHASILADPAARRGRRFGRWVRTPSERA
ncbi:hypothetical protein GCM10007964_14720 [Sphaerisporangium melleum]|uniref:Uncharacterized protein n=1 Tax=Sphaerisporangium melleum TaxID=321316 RepID=A0A917QWA3_9ACTN|nr:hypothetical protein GCM10007964_14720 [Sphaerisporangium melleum]